MVAVDGGGQGRHRAAAVPALVVGAAGLSTARAGPLGAAYPLWLCSEATKPEERERRGGMPLNQQCAGAEPGCLCAASA